MYGSTAMKRTLLNAAIVFAPIFVVTGRLVQAARARARGDHERDFLYAAGDRRHLLVWVVIPPFARQFYNFEADRWIKELI